MWSKDLHYYGNQGRELLIFAEAEETREDFPWVKALNRSFEGWQRGVKGYKDIVKRRDIGERQEGTEPRGLFGITSDAMRRTDQCQEVGIARRCI